MVDISREREHEILKELGKTLLNVSKSKGYNVQMLSKASGISPSSIYKITWGIGNPNFMTMYKICKVLDIELNDLYLVKESKEEDKDEYEKI